MGKITTQEIIDKKTWETFLRKYPEANFLQSWEWGEFHKALGHSITRTGFFQENKLKGVMLSVVEKAKRATYLTVPGGPIIDWKDKALVNAFKNQAIQIAQAHGCSFARVRPQLES